VQEDAKVEPLGPDEQVEEGAAAGKQPVVLPFNPAKTRERMRVRLGFTIVMAAMAAGAAGAISAMASGAGTDKILTGVFSPLLGLAGAVVGFYFGGKDGSV